MINGKKAEMPLQGTMFYVDKVRIVVAHQKTGKIYYDRSFPEGCLPLAKQERLSPEEYQKYLAEQERILAEQNAEKQRQAQAKIMEERRKEQERIEAAKHKEQEKIAEAKRKQQEERDADIKRYMSQFSFDNISDYKFGGRYSTKGKFQGTPLFIDDTPNGKGKSVLMDKKTYLNLIKWTYYSHGIISLWIKMPDNNKNQQYFRDEYYFSKLANDNISVCNDNQWHWVCIVKNCVSEREDNTHLYPQTYISGEYDYYIDGKLIKQAIFPKRKENPFNKYEADFSIGNKKGNMIINDLRLYSIRLTAEEIAKIYEEEKGEN
jgi:hypothetical protein